MLKAQHITKKFDNFTALSDVSCTVPDGCIYGLVGSNGAGKSTFLRTVCGIYRPDEGEVTFDDQPIFENPDAKSNIVFVPDDLYFLHNASVDRMASLYRAAYRQFDMDRYNELINRFRLPRKKSISTFSKGMRRLTSTALALSVKPKLILFDETMDGLDPIMRHIVKTIIAEDITERGTSAVVVSHSLRELEDLCDQLALLHQGGIVLEQDVTDLKTSVFKVQVAFSDAYDREKFSDMSLLHYHQQGAVAQLILNGDREQVSAQLRDMEPLLLEILPLTLEEVFTYELQARNYDFSTLMGGEQA